MYIPSVNSALAQNKMRYDNYPEKPIGFSSRVNFCALEAIIFDADGTMVNTSKYHKKAWASLVLRHPPKRIFKLLANFPRLGSTNEIVAQIYPSASPQKVYKYSAEKENLFLKLAKNLKEIRGFSNFVNSVNGVKMGIATCASQENLSFYLRKLNLAEKFNDEFIVDSSKVTRFKPDPEVYTKAMKSLGVVSKNCVAFEDSEEGIKAAIGAGMKVVGVASSLSKEALIKLGASLAIKDYTEINLEKLKSIL